MNLYYKQIQYSVDYWFMMTEQDKGKNELVVRVKSFLICDHNSGCVCSCAKAHQQMDERMTDTELF